MIRKVLLDTGPLVALLDKGDEHHRWCGEQIRLIEPPLLTCEAVLAEACHLLGGHPTAVATIRAWLREGTVKIAFSMDPHSDEVFERMHSYRNLPMSLADACLVSMSDRITDSHVFTLDGHFQIYRRQGRKIIRTIFPTPSR